MKKRLFVLGVLGCLLVWVSQMSRGQGSSQSPIADKIADKLIQHYQTSSCQQLQQEKQQPPAGEKAAIERKVIETLHNDAELRKHFLDRVAGPIVNKLFECGFIP